MKINLKLLVSFTSFLILSLAHAEGPRSSAMKIQRIEVPLEDVMAPYHGYDNTNNVEAVLHGDLPNPCYQLDKATVEHDHVNHKIKVHQYAIKKMDGVCGESNAMPIHLSMVVPFTNVVSFGVLKAGNHTYSFNENFGSPNEKSLNVKEAHKTTIDDYPYASVSNLITSSVIQKNEKISVTLSGVLTSSCAYLDRNSIQVEKQKDVYVVRPVLKVKTNVFCIQTLVPFVEEVEIDAPKLSGHYLVHVRSMNGKSVNSVIEAND